MSAPLPPLVSGYVLAGGRSSRMGRDKATLELAGKPLIEHAVVKLRRLATDVHVLSSNPALGAYAPVVSDLHPGCGPMGGIEAALTHARQDWSLVLPVDVPFLPTAFLDDWVRGVLLAEGRGCRLSIFRVDDVPQPALLMIHRDCLPYLTHAINLGTYKLFPVLDAAAQSIAERTERFRGYVFRNLPWGERAGYSKTPGYAAREQAAWQTISEIQDQLRPDWFANLNTPEDFLWAEGHGDALDT